MQHIAIKIACGLLREFSILIRLFAVDVRFNFGLRTFLGLDHWLIGHYDLLLGSHPFEFSPPIVGDDPL